MSVVVSSPGVPSRQSTGVVHSVAPVTMSAAPTWPVGQAIEKTRPSPVAPATTSGPRLTRHRSSPWPRPPRAVGPSTADGVAGFPGAGSAGTVVGAEEPVTGVVVPGSLVGADTARAARHDHQRRHRRQPARPTHLGNMPEPDRNVTNSNMADAHRSRPRLSLTLLSSQGMGKLSFTASAAAGSTRDPLAAVECYRLTR